MKESFNLKLSALFTGNKQKEFPKNLCILPVFKKPYFPGRCVPISIDPGIQYDTIKTITQSEVQSIGIVFYNEPIMPYERIDKAHLSHIGVAGHVTEIVAGEAGGFDIIVTLEKRFKINKIKKEDSHFWAKVTYLDDVHDLPMTKLKAYSANIISTVKNIISLSPTINKSEFKLFLEHADPNNPGLVADMAAATTTASNEDLTELLNTLSIGQRLKHSLILIKKELDLHKIQNEIDIQVEMSMHKTQKDFILREQLKTIKKELGIEQDKSREILKLEQRIIDKDIPESTLKIIQEEIERLTHIDKQSSEYSMTRSYIDWITSIPWGSYSNECLDIKKIMQVLNKEHWGMQEVKERICEIVAVSKMAGSSKGSIICLVGPPGVGKTTIARSISKALGRKFFKFSVGGMKDEAEIKGHRRTYVGSMPGKLIQALKISKSMNPVILVDEIDKIGSDSSGDPASALLEAFDTEQNNAFIDHYIDFPCDLSKVMFILSANMIDIVPEALKDRFECITLSGYVTEEKIAIANKHLIPKNLTEVGLNKKSVSFDKEAIQEIIVGYARESGVRNLEFNIKKILRKLILNHLQSSNTKFNETTVTTKIVKKLLGQPKFLEDPNISNTPIGVCVGLAWTSMGGETLCVETLCLNASKESMKLTGQAGSVMKESAEIAWSFCKKWVLDNNYNVNFFSTHEIHIHLPEGATPKDGPSAGVTMVTAILSQVLSRKVRPFLAMTGEITLNGNVLPVGGIREKIAAAKRSKLNCVIIPYINRQEFEELPTVLKQNLDVHFVKSYDDVFGIAFPDILHRQKK